MAERIFLAGAIEILKKLSSFPEEEIILIWGMKKEFNKLKETFPMIQAVLRDAEMRQVKEEPIRLWLKRLKDVAYEVDDVLDEFSFEAMRGKVDIRNSKMKKVYHFFSHRNKIVFRSRMAHKIKDINKKLDKIEKDMKMLNFKVGDVNDRFANDINRETDASLDNSQTIGREKEKSMLIDMLIGSCNEELSVIPIVGIGGLGKTTLAKIVYNNESVVAHFRKRMWICVSDDFNVKRLVGEMLESLTGEKPNLSNLEAIQCKLAANLRGKRFLLVLDDVWNGVREKWDDLRASLVIGAKGSKIVLTTRKEEVALIMGTHPPQHLVGLSENESWSLFRRRAFGSGGATENSNMVRIGKELVEKCKGVPLAIKSLSALMHSKKNEHEWLSIQYSEIWNISEDGNGILSVLILSYDHLSLPLKRCFAYCSMFPKDYRIQKKTLIQLWMAEGLLQSSNGCNKLMEDIGDEYFKSLVCNSFFQDVERDKYGEEVACKMHDLVHDLAQFIIGNECMMVEDFDKVEPKLETRYLSLVGCIETTPKKFHIMERVCAHLWLGKNIRGHHISADMFLNFRSLPVLDLNDARIKSLPSTIGELKHLRYLDLLGNKFETLPKSVTNLYNLQTLKVLRWYNYLRLPKGVTKMINLRHLEFDDRTLRFPRGIGQLTNLQTLSLFLDTQDFEAAGIQELKNLQQLRGLNLYNLEMEKNAKKNATVANLKGKPRLGELCLEWNYPESDNDVCKTLLEDLQPHPNLISLQIRGFTGLVLPTWMDGSSYLSSLQDLQLDECTNIMSFYLVGLSSLRRLQIVSCTNLRSLGLKGLTSLEAIRLQECKKLISIGVPNKEDGMPVLISLRILEINCCYSLATLPDGFFILLRSLETLQVSNCSILRALPDSIGNLSSLQMLIIEGCDNLTSLPDGMQHLRLLQTLKIFECPYLVALPYSLGDLSSLRELDICDCPGLIALPESLGNLVALEKLRIFDCPGLEALPKGLGNLSSLQVQGLDTGDSQDLTVLPKNLGDLTSSLKELEIYRCPNLASLPEGIRCLMSLKKLSTVRCHNSMSFPDWIQDLVSLHTLHIAGFENLGVLPDGLKNLSILRELHIGECLNLMFLPDWIQEFTLLKKLHIEMLENLRALPEGLEYLSSLEDLFISHCKSLMSLPEGIQNLRSLRRLNIIYCPQLGEKYKRGEDGNWPKKIAHIPYIGIVPLTG
ncbi:disease resistance protein RGA2-like [Telopea speciosissima]|uniref:disease resistance protein RGA2-like n=1 Tax=Telopea speciosissima TaxID=54955 RepID=UPI001CC68843|nr:disease resistance protein RGA2-like [Telopea speciosissima]